MKKVMLLIFAIVVAVSMVLTLSLAGCKAEEAKEETATAETTETETTETETTETETTETETTEQKQRVIGVTLIIAPIDHCQDIAQAVKDVAEPKGDRVIVLDDDVSVEQEIQNVEDLVALGVDGIILETLSYDATDAVLQSAKDAGIPVAAIDQMVMNQDLVISNNTSDNYMAGVLAAQDMIKKMKSGTVITLADSTSDAGRQRLAGFVETIEKDGLDIEIVLSEETKHQIDIVASQVEDFLQKYPDLTGFFGGSDREGIGASIAFSASGKDPIFVYSVDGSPDALELIKEGKMGGSVQQRPYEMGKLAIENLYKYFDGIELTEQERTMMLPVSLITIENVDEYCE